MGIFSGEFAITLSQHGMLPSVTMMIPRSLQLDAIVQLALQFSGNTMPSEGQISFIQFKQGFFAGPLCFARDSYIDHQQQQRSASRYY